MVKVLELTNKQFGMLKVISRNPKNTAGGNSRWDCICDCGVTKTVAGGHLTSGGTKSCGCIMKESSRTSNLTHGLSNISEYNIWVLINRRGNYTDEDIARGRKRVEVCTRWKGSFENFYRDVGPRPSLSHILKRRDPNKSYEPNNCYWYLLKDRKKNKPTTKNKDTIKGISAWTMLFGKLGQV